MGEGSHVTQEKQRILVTDDEPRIAEALRHILEREGYEVLLAVDGQEGVEIARREQPDLILLDVMMPRMDGHEACRNLRSHFRTRHIPIVMLTAKGSDEERMEGLGFGVNDYIAKPWKSNKELVQRVKNQLDFSRGALAVSPLTGLPGNLSIMAERDRRVSAGEAFAQMFLDIDSFKAFNDRYGFPRGDTAIRAVADTLVEVIETQGEAGDFIGHIGGDDFWVLTVPERAEDLAEAIKNRLEARMPDLYDAEDREKGMVRVLNRRHEFEDFPLMSVTIAVAEFDPATGAHLAEVDDALRELKQFGKTLPGYVVVSERRRRQNGAPDAPYGGPPKLEGDAEPAPLRKKSKAA